MGRDDLKSDPRTADGTARAANADFIRAIIENWLAGKSRTEAVDTLAEQGVPSGPVYTAEDVFNDPHVAARRMLVSVDDPVAGPHRFARSPVHLSAASEIRTTPAPRLGEHSASILKELLGYDQESIDELASNGVIGLFKSN
jgi:formyl-CoA transferase